MLVVAVVIAALGPLSAVWFGYEYLKGVKYRQSQQRYIKVLQIIGEEHHKFILFLLEALSKDSEDQLRYKIFKYLHENKIDLSSVEH